jgi:hypothetical protein
VPGDRPDDLVDRAYQVGASAVAEAAGANPAAAVDRRGAIRALGIIQIVLGGVAGFIATAGFVMMAIGQKRMAMAAPGLAYLVPAVNLLVTGIGSVKIARWARRATLISAGIWLGLVLLAAASMLVMGGAGMGRKEAALAAVIMVPVFVVFLALPIVLLVVYTRPSVRATFERRAG